jgi:hypothetical protein
VWISLMLFDWNSYETCPLCIYFQTAMKYLSCTVLLAFEFLFFQIGVNR